MQKINKAIVVRIIVVQKNTFILDYNGTGWLAEIKEQIIKMTINGSVIRDTVRVLGIGMHTIIGLLKKTGKQLKNINLKYMLQTAVIKKL